MWHVEGFTGSWTSTSVVHKRCSQTQAYYARSQGGICSALIPHCGHAFQRGVCARKMYVCAQDYPWQNDWQNLKMLCQLLLQATHGGATFVELPRYIRTQNTQACPLGTSSTSRTGQRSSSCPAMITAAGGPSSAMAAHRPHCACRGHTRWQ